MATWTPKIDHVDKILAADINALQTYKMDVITPEQYGAKGDGVTDDTAAIQAAIDYLDSARGGTLYFGPKIYNITSTINLKSNIRYLGHAQMNPTGAETSVTGTTLIWGGADGNIMVYGIGVCGILWDGINLYGKYEVAVPLTNGLTGLRITSVNAPISWRNKFRNFEVWYCDIAVDFGHHTVSYESDMFEISDFNFYKVNTGIASYSYNGTQGSVIKNGRIHPYDRGIYLKEVSLLKISQITFGSLNATPVNGNFIEIDEIGDQLIIEGCQGEGLGPAAWTDIKFVHTYSASAHRPTILIGNTFNRLGVHVEGAYDIVGIGNLYYGTEAGINYTLDFSGNNITYHSIGDVFGTDNERRDTGTDNFFGIGMDNGSLLGQIAGPLLTFDDTNNLLNLNGAPLTIRPASNVIGGQLGIIGAGPSRTTHPAIGPTAYMAAYNEGAAWYNGTALAFFTHNGPDSTDPGDPATEIMRLSKDGNLGLGINAFGTSAAKVVAQSSGTAPSTSPADAYQQYSADAGAVAGQAGPHFRTEGGGIFGMRSDTGTTLQYVYQKDDLADDGTVTLPDATSGMVLVSCNAEAGMWLVQADGTVTKISGSTNTAAADSDGNLCVYDGGTGAIVKNRLNATGEIRIVYYYN